MQSLDKRLQLKYLQLPYDIVECKYCVYDNHLGDICYFNPNPTIHSKTGLHSKFVRIVSCGKVGNFYKGRNNS